MALLFPPPLAPAGLCALLTCGRIVGFSKALAHTLRLVVDSTMLSLSKDNKIFNSVIIFDSIDVVDKLSRFQRPSKFLAHNQTVLWNIPLGVGIRMVRGEDEDVVSLPNSATFPFVAFFSEFLFGMARNIRQRVPPKTTLRSNCICSNTCLLATATLAKAGRYVFLSSRLPRFSKRNSLFGGPLRVVARDESRLNPVSSRGHIGFRINNTATSTKTFSFFHVA